MSISGFLASITYHIQLIGYIWFFVLILGDIVLWRVHPALGTIGAVLIAAYLLGMF